MSYQPGAPGEWGSMQAGPGISIATEELLGADGCKHFLRSWITGGQAILLILHGLGGHNGWYIDMGNVLASRGITVYAMDHRGFGRSGGLAGDIDDYHTYVKDIVLLLTEMRQRHPAGGIYLLGHSMGGLFTTHVAAEHAEQLAGILLLNPWIQDTGRLPFLTVAAIFLTGLFKSQRYWQVAGGPEVMTTNTDAVRMLLADPLWHRKQTARMLFQVSLMRLGAFSKARQITLPTLVMQALADKAVDIAANQKLYEALASQQKTWKTYPGYMHDSEFEHNRSQMDHDIATWIDQQTRN